MSDADPAARLQALLERGQRLEHEARAAVPRVLEMLGIPEEGPVRAVYDAERALTGFEFEPDWRDGLEPAALVAEFNRALGRAMLSGALAMPAATTASIGAEPPAPAEFANLGKSVVVTAVMGTTVRVEITESWIASTADRDVAREIVALSAEARVAQSTADPETPNGQPT